MCEDRVSSVPWLTIPAVQLLEPREVKAHTLPDLVSRTVSRTKRAAKNCSSTEIAEDRSQMIWAYRTLCNESNSAPTGHISHIRILPQYRKGGQVVVQDASAVAGKPFKDLHVAVRCSCPAFLYWVSQWIAYNEGFLAGKPQGLLVAPQVRFRFKDGASTKRSLVCKHLISCARIWITEPPF